MSTEQIIATVAAGAGLLYFAYYKMARASRKVAVCELTEAGKPCHGAVVPSGVTGCVKLTHVAGLGDHGLTTIEYDVRGLTPGLHGFHIHEKSDFSNGCLSAGGHYNPHGKKHGGPKDAECHVGDLGNIEAGADGIAKGKILSCLIKLDGEFSVIGRSFMVHADEDDLGRGDSSQPGPPPVNGKASLVTGNAGARLACGEIKLL